jgi:hypothetical protein
VDDEIIEIVEYSLDEARKLIEKGTSHTSPPTFLYIGFFQIVRQNNVLSDLCCQHNKHSYLEKKNYETKM